ncbi:MAG TPA: prepilin-type N-terminal cleavage/methylation domain-containing protein [Pyrinomonadaceae bacterium]
MNSTSKKKNEAGFSLIEMIIALGVLVVLTASISTLLRDTMKVTTATYEMTDAQETLRIAQEYINRDLMNAGDGLKSISTIRVPKTFVQNYLTLNPVTDTSMPNGTINLGIITSDNNTPANTAVTDSDPAATVRSGSDRQTVLELDSAFTPIALPASPTASINSTGSSITVSASDISRFNVGEIYFVTSALGGTFVAITAKNNSTRVLTVANGDDYGLNVTGTSGNLKIISTGGTLPTSLMRMKMIHYYITTDKLLMRREFGVANAGFRDSIIAEHVLNVQFNYSLNIVDDAGNVAQPTGTIANTEQRLAVRQVEVTVTVESPKTLANGTQPTLSGTTSTSVRNMQFRQALQPTSGG